MIFTVVFSYWRSSLIPYVLLLKVVLKRVLCGWKIERAFIYAMSLPLDAILSHFMHSMQHIFFPSRAASVDILLCPFHPKKKKSIENIVEDVLPVTISSSVDILFDWFRRHQFEICCVLVHVKTKVDVSGCGKMCHGCRSKLRIMCSR